MDRKLFSGQGLGTRLRRREQFLEGLWLSGFLLAAFILYSLNLGELPLRDWDEGTVAQVAKEIFQGGQTQWLFPTLWDSPYLNKPPLIHGLIAWVYSLGGIHEWTTRLPSALLTAFSVPLLYGVGRELFPSRTPAVLSTCLYLTWLPVVRHGRLAMLDGPVLCFELLLLYCILRSRRSLRWSLGVGLAFSLICLTKGIMGLLIGAIAFLFLLWDTPRLLYSLYFWVGIALGSLPGMIWYGLQFDHYQNLFVQTGLVGQSFQRIWDSVEDHQGPPWYYLLELLKYAFPGLLFSLYGLRLSWNNRTWSWAKFILVWTGVYGITVSIMATKLPWYILPIYPALALAGGVQLAEIWNLPSSHPYPPFWKGFFVILTVAILLGCFYFYTFGHEDHLYSLLLICVSLAFTLGITTGFIVQNNRQFIPILFWGFYVALMLFISSPHWIWELNEAFPVKPVAEVINANVPKGKPVYMTFDYERPSLNFYSDRQVFKLDSNQVQQSWQNAQSSEESFPAFLLDPRSYQNLKKDLEKEKEFDKVKVLQTLSPKTQLAGWILVTNNNSI